MPPPVTQQGVHDLVLGGCAERKIHRLWRKTREKKATFRDPNGLVLAHPDFGLGERLRPDMGVQKPNN
jgi:hypothetical protein